MASVLTDPRQKALYMAPVSKQPRHKIGSMASGDNRGQKVASPQYASVPDPRQNVENNRGRKPLLHWCLYACYRSQAHKTHWNPLNMHLKKTT